MRAEPVPRELHPHAAELVDMDVVVEEAGGGAAAALTPSSAALAAASTAAGPAEPSAPGPTTTAVWRPWIRGFSCTSGGR